LPNFEKLLDNFISSIELSGGIKIVNTANRSSYTIVADPTWSNLAIDYVTACFETNQTIVVGEIDDCYLCGSISFKAVAISKTDIETTCFGCGDKRVHTAKGFYREDDEDDDDDYYSGVFSSPDTER
jgi:hypothetical protein